MSTIAKICKEPRCSSTDEWIKKKWYIYIYTMEYYSAIRKDEYISFNISMDGTGGDYAK